MPSEELAINAAPQPILAQRQVHPDGWALHKAASNKALEVQAAAQWPDHTLMRRAGLAVARWAMAWTPHCQHISLLIGPGNNGGDALEAAIHLKRAGYAVRGHFILPEGEDRHTHAWPPDAAQSLRRAFEAQIELADGLPTADDDAMAGSQHLILDGLLGRGLSRTVAGPLQAAIDWANDCHARGSQVLALDVPSGLPADTGSLTAGSRCIHADATLALLSLPPGLFMADGRNVSGDIWFHDLGVEANAANGVQACLVSQTMLARQAPRRAQAAHKGTFGDVLVMGGAPGMAGAARLAARAALYGGAGRVYAAYLRQSEPGSEAQSDASSDQAQATEWGGDPDCPEVMHADARRVVADLQAWSRAVIVAGCGGGALIRSFLPTLLAQAPRLVLDADALNAVSTDPVLQAALGVRAANGQTTILTPHPLEAARLLACSVGEIQADRLAAAQSLSDRTASVVILKGSGTLATLPRQHAPGALPWLLAVGNAGLSTAGSGDVLAGLIGAHWGQWSSHESTPPAAAQALTMARLAAASAAYLHGITAEAISPDGNAIPASVLAQALRGHSIHTGLDCGT